MMVEGFKCILLIGINHYLHRLKFFKNDKLDAINANLRTQTINITLELK